MLVEGWSELQECPVELTRGDIMAWQTKVFNEWWCEMLTWKYQVFCFLFTVKYSEQKNREKVNKDKGVEQSLRWTQLARCLLSTDIMLQIMMLTWISLVHPLKISGLVAWQCTDWLWTAYRLHQSSLFSSLLPVWIFWLFISPLPAASRPKCSSDRMHLHKACSLCSQCAFIHNLSGPLLIILFTRALQTDQRDSLSHYKVWFLLVRYVS